MGDVELGPVAASVAWELARVPARVRERELARLRAESPAFHRMVTDHLAALRV